MNVGVLAGRAACAAVIAFTASASAQIRFLETTMDGTEEVPPNNSPGTGTARVRLNIATGEVVLTGSYSGLLANSTLAHIHGLAPRGATASPIVDLTHSFATSGTVGGSGVLNQTQIDGMLNGLTYINVHSTQFAAGEIRGQFELVPAPGAGGVLALAALAVMRRRR
jgi:hypothetical protein